MVGPCIKCGTRAELRRGGFGRRGGGRVCWICATPTFVEYSCVRCGGRAQYQLGKPAKRYCGTTCRNSDAAVTHVLRDRTCDECGEVWQARSSKYRGVELTACPRCRARGGDARKNGLRRARTEYTDMTAIEVAGLLAAATHCVKCRVALTDAPYQRTSRELDHILPLHVGGAHVRSNVRVLCKGCNAGRPKDGSDEYIQLSLWDRLVRPVRGRRIVNERERLRRRRLRTLRRRSIQVTHARHAYPSPRLVDDAVRVLYAGGLGQKAISRRLGIGRGPVKASYERLGLAPQTPEGVIGRDWVSR